MHFFRNIIAASLVFTVTIANAELCKPPFSIPLKGLPIADVNAEQLGQSLTDNPGAFGFGNISNLDVVSEKTDIFGNYRKTQRFLLDVMPGVLNNINFEMQTLISSSGHTTLELVMVSPDGQIGSSTISIKDCSYGVLVNDTTVEFTAPLLTLLEGVTGKAYRKAAPAVEFSSILPTRILRHAEQLSQ